jgi:cytochrome b561
VKIRRCELHIPVLPVRSTGTLSCGLEILFHLLLREMLKCRADVSGSVGAAGEDMQTAAAALHALYGILFEVPLKSCLRRSAVMTLSIAAVTTPCNAAVSSDRWLLRRSL